MHIRSDSTQEAKFQRIDTILDLLEEKGADAILMGDWNIEPDENPMAYYTATGRMTLLTDEILALRPTRRDENGPTGRHIDYGATVGEIDAGHSCILPTDYKSSIGSDHEMIGYTVN